MVNYLTHLNNNAIKLLTMMNRTNVAFFVATLVTATMSTYRDIFFSFVTMRVRNVYILASFITFQSSYINYVTQSYENVNLNFFFKQSRGAKASNFSIRADIENLAWNNFVKNICVNEQSRRDKNENVFFLTGKM